MIFDIDLMNTIIEINSCHSYVYEECRDYACKESPEIHIRSTIEDIEKEKSIYLKSEKNINNKISDGYLESLSIYRKIAEAMLDFSTFLMHGSVIATDMDHCYMFTAPSGTGKTTHIKLWLENLPDSFVVNGDKPLLKIEKDKVLACGTPWCGKEGWNTNCMVPLKGIVILERAEDNNIQELSFKDAFPTLFRQTYCPNGIDKMKKTLILLSLLKKHVKFYRMQINNFKNGAFETSYELITNGI